MIIEADELALREGLCHDDGRGSMAAADVRDLCTVFELVEHVLERRNPAGDEVGAIAGAEKFLAAAEHALVVLVPADARSGAKGLGDLGLVDIGRSDELERRRHIDGRILVRQCHPLLGIDGKAAVGGIVIDETGSRLRREPLAHIAFIQLEMLR